MQASAVKTDRNSGIDLLRVILSFCVITIHILHYGGFRAHADMGNTATYFLWFLGVVIDCTVNCFAIVSGFVLYNHQIKYTKILRLLLTV